MKELWVDYENGKRGGSEYIRRRVDWIARRGGNAEIKLVSGSIGKKVAETVRLVMGTWHRDYDLCGTAPAVFIAALFARKSWIYIQSPTNEWSRLSRLGLWLLSYWNSCKMVAVSDSVIQSIESGFTRGRCLKSYAKFTECCSDVDMELELPLGRVAVAILFPRDYEKGHIESLALLHEISRNYELEIELYGKTLNNVYEYEALGVVSNNGYIEKPLRHFCSKHRGKRMYYVGLSHYEGMPLSVLEAAQLGIPSIVSGIPAHLELERITNCRMRIYDVGNEKPFELGGIGTSCYDWECEVKEARKMFDRFKEHADKEDMQAVYLG